MEWDGMGIKDGNWMAWAKQHRKYLSQLATAKMDLHRGASTVAGA